MLSINTNLSSLIAQNSMKTSTDKLNQAIERMSTGFKINHAKDNAANYSISTNLTTQLNSYNIAADNVAMGMDLVNTFNESIELISDKLSRLRQLALQLENGTYGSSSKQAIIEESNALLSEIERIYNNTEYNGIDLIKGKSVNAIESKFIKDIERRDTSEMTRLKSVSVDESIDSGTYSIYTAEELAQLAEMTNKKLIGTNAEFVLGADINLEMYENWTPIGTRTTDGSINAPFKASFDGNGYVISKLKINTTDFYVGLFGNIESANIKNLGIEGANVYSASNSVGVLVGQAIGSAIINNCYVYGELSARSNVAGICGNFKAANMINCYSEVNITATGTGVGGLAGTFDGRLVENCFTTGNVTGWNNVGGLFGYFSNSTGVVNSCYSTATTIGTKEGASVDDVIGKIVDIASLNLAPIDSISTDALVKTQTNKLELQIGINSDMVSCIELNALLSLSQFSYLKNMNSENSSRCISIIDELNSQLNEKMISNGALLNRLESILEEISIKYENLVSSRSTIRDADIAEVSAEYIQQQILQQAAATLMSTANQSSAIALQLI